MTFNEARVVKVLIDVHGPLVLNQEYGGAAESACERIHKRISKGNFVNVLVTKIQR